MGKIITEIPRIALIGCGAIAESYYLPALLRHPDVLGRLIFVDSSIDRAQKMAKDFGGKHWVSDYHDVLDEVDGAIIAVPTYLHHSISLDFLSRGVPVLCEKPLAESAHKAKEMIEMASKTNTAFATNYSQRLWAQFAKVKEIIVNQSLGELQSIKYVVGEIFNWPTVSGFHFKSTGSNRGVLLDRGAHILDHICWWVGGKPEVISCENDSFGGSEAVTQVKFRYKGCVGEIRLSWLSSFPCKFIVEFEHGSVEGEVYYPQSVLIRSNSGVTKRVSLKSETYDVLGRKIIANFIGVINGGEKPLVPASDVLDSISFTDDCYEVVTRFEMPWYEMLEVENG